jgi:flagellar biosynthesis/type III secretory pathway protein FliH
VHELIVILPLKLRGVETGEPASAISARPATSTTQPAGQVALEQLMTRLSEMARTLQSQYRQKLSEMERASLNLAVAIASRLVHQTIRNGDFGIEKLVHDMIEQLNVKEPITIYLHPEDHLSLEQRLANRTPTDWAASAVRFVTDGSLERGCCRAEAAELQIVSRLDEQIASIHKHLTASIDDG